MTRTLICGSLLFVLLTSTTYSTDIYEAIDSGRVEQVTQLLQQTPDLLNARNSNKMTPLNLAAYRGQAAIVQTLLELGADASIGDNENSQPIHNAAVAGQIEVIDLLLTHGVDINSQDANGMTALLFSISYRQNETIDFLLDHGASAKIAANNGNTALHYAALRGQAELIKRLLAQGADINAQTFEGQTPLHFTLRSNQLAAAELLLQSGAEIDIPEDYGRTPLLFTARETGKVEMARLLVNYGANVNARDRHDDTPLVLAAWRGFSAVVGLLLDSGADVPVTGNNGRELLTYAVEKGLNRPFRLLVEKGADLSINSYQGGTLLHAAAMGGSTEIINILVNKGFVVNDDDAFGWTPLHYAANKGRVDAAELLIAKGAELNARTKSGNSAYNLARAKERTGVIQLFLKHNADTSGQQFPELTGPYLGQTPPGITPQLFAADIASTIYGQHSSVAFSPAGDEVLWSATFFPNDSGYSVGALLSSKRINGKWTPPQFPEFTVAFETRDDVPFFAPNGDKLYFISRRPLQPNQRGGKENIWVVDRTESGWGPPRPVPGAINHMQMHWQFSVSNNGTIFFPGEDPSGFGLGDIYYSELVDGEYTTPQNLGAIINTPSGETCPYIAPDESYLIFASSGHQGEDTRTYIHVSYRTKDNQWSEPISTGLEGLCPIISPDGKYLFYNGHYNGLGGIYWLKADFLE